MHSSSSSVSGQPSPCYSTGLLFASISEAQVYEVKFMLSRAMKSLQTLGCNKICQNLSIQNNLSEGGECFSIFKWNN